MERDAHLRTEFNINTGFRDGDMKKVKLKSEMKRYYNMAGIKTSRYCLVTSKEGGKRFIDQVGYSLIVKPDKGVGASDNHKACYDGALEHFFYTKPT